MNHSHPRVRTAGTSAPRRRTATKAKRTATLLVAAFAGLFYPAAVGPAHARNHGSGGHSINGRIVLIREDDQGNDSAYTIAPDGAGEHLVSPGDWAHWSPNGREIGVHSADGVPVTIVTVATGAARDLPTPDPDFVCGPTTTEEQCAQTDFSCPIWTPNGRRLTCTGSSGVNP